MRIVDVCAFYTPAGGGVRTYVDAKLRAAARFGHEMIVIAPGERRCDVIQRGPGAMLVTIFHRRSCRSTGGTAISMTKRALHAVLDAWRPDHVEASSPWSSATMVGRWQGAASRSLVMHSDPLAAYAYRWLGGVASSETIDRWFGWFWRHLRGLGRMFDMVVCANCPAYRTACALAGSAIPKRCRWASSPAFSRPRSLRDAARGSARAARAGSRRRVADRRWPLLGGEALGHGHARSRRVRADRRRRLAARRRRTRSAKPRNCWPTSCPMSP